MESASGKSAGVAFGRFQVLPHRRELLADSEPVRLGGRAFDVLMALIEARGAVLGKNALMARIWPDRIVEENALQAQIVALRRAFGGDRDLIRTVSGRGYQFTGEIRALSEGAGAQRAGLVPEPAALPATNVPEPVSELIGREDELAEIVNLIGAHRLVTLTGSGGIGKTRLALAAAHRLLPHFADGVWLVRLSTLADPGLVPAAVAAAVGLELSGEASVQSVAQAVAGRKLLLVLDTCEHVIEVAASMAEAALGVGSELRIVATSREPLRAAGEWVYSVPPLAMPADDDQDNDEPLRYAAIRLFVERARAAAFPNFTPDRRLMAMIAAICRRLDGLPLAIELAAARVPTLSVEEITTRLNDYFNLLTGGWRTALPRHQTLRATLDWSYELLSERECVILRRLGIFAGPFSLEGASAVAATAEISASDVVDGLASLVAKSLVSIDAARTVARYRLLDTTRGYALEKLIERGEREEIQRRHAEFYRDLFEQAEVELETQPTDAWLANYGQQIDDVRTTLDWAFSPDGDASLGAALTAAAVTLWMQLSLPEECRTRVGQALAALQGQERVDPRCEMKLNAALGASLAYTRAATGADTGAAWTKALSIAERLGDAEYQLRSLWGLWFFYTAAGRHRMALELAQKFHTLEANRPVSNHHLVAERLIGTSLHYLGDQTSARRHIERVLANYIAPDPWCDIIRFQLDQRMVARVVLARILWLQGFPDQAMCAAESSVVDARATDHAVSLCYALALAACPIALLVGDLAAAEQSTDALLAHSTKHSLTRWRALGDGHQGILAIKRGDVAGGLPLLRTGFDELGEAKFAVMRSITFVMAEALVQVGRLSEGLAVVDEGIAQSEHSEERSLFAGFLHLKGELLLLQGAPGAAATAEDHFRQALDCARRQGALSWELRAATSLARLMRNEGHTADAKAILEPVYGRFTEGFDTADLNAARVLLHAL